MICVLLYGTNSTMTRRLINKNSNEMPRVFCFYQTTLLFSFTQHVIKKRSYTKAVFYVQLNNVYNKFKF